MKNELGRTGVMVPPIIFGTSALGNLYKSLDEKTKLEIMANWFKWVQPPVVIDTAGKYGAGQALEVIGNGLRELGIRPEEIIISNKLGWYQVDLESPEPTFEPGVWMDLQHDAVQKISYEGILACYEQGLDLLGRDYSTDVVSVHDPDEYLNQIVSKEEQESRMNDILEGYQALLELKNQGKARAIGVGAKDWKVIKLIAEKVDLDWVMLATSFTIMDHPKELMEFMDELKHRNISVINSAVFHGGFLTGSDYYNYEKLDKNSPTARSLYEWRSLFYHLCEKYEIEPADACINFGLSYPGINAIALNTSRPDAIKKNVAMISEQIPQRFWQELKEYELLEPDYQYV